MSGTDVSVRRRIRQVETIMPLAQAEQREAAPLKHLDLPDDLPDHDEPEQGAIDTGDYSDAVGIWRGPPPN